MEVSSNQRGLMAEGIAVGMVGAVAVALWFLIVDLLNGVAFQTPGALGSALFLGIRSPDAVVVNATTVGLYTVFHGVAYSLVGIAAAALMRAADRLPSFIALIILAAVVLEALFLGGVAILAQFLLGFLAWWAVLGGNILAAVAMGGLLLRWHPSTAALLTKADAPIPVR